MSIWITVLGLVGLLTFAVLMLPAAKRLAFPYTVLLAAVGTLLGLFQTAIGDSQVLGPVSDFLAALSSFDITADAVFFIFLPALIFEAALSIDVRRLLDDITPILTLAIIGLLLSTFTIGFALEWATAMPLLVCLLIGAICSATDPVAVIALFKEVGAPKRLSILVEGESLFNDATAIVLFTILAGMIINHSEASFTHGAFTFLKVFVGGVLLGFLFGKLLCWLMSLFSQLVLVNITLSICFAYLTFIVAEHYFHVSGVMAVVVAAMVTGSIGRTILNPQHWFELEHSWEQTGFWANSIIFILVGMAVPKLLSHVTPTAMTGLITLIISAMVARAVITYGLLPALSSTGMSRAISTGYKTVMFWGGLRGAVSLALALAIIENPKIDKEYQEFIAVLVTGFVLFTLFVNATTIRAIINLFGLGKLSPIEIIMRDKALANSLSNVATYIAKAHHSLQINKAHADKVIEEYETKSLQHQNIKIDANKVSDEEWLGLGLSILGSQEKRYYYALFSEARLQPHIFRILIAHNEDLLDALKTDKLSGYQRQMLRNLAFDWRFKIAAFEHRHFSSNNRLARRLAERLSILMAKQAALTHIQETHLAKLEEFLGEKAFKQLLPVYEERLKKTKQALTALSGQYPSYAEKLKLNQLYQIVLKQEDQEYRHLLKDGLITEDVFKSLSGDLHKKINHLAILPALDLHLEPSDLIAKVPLFSHCSQAHLAKISALMTPMIAFPEQKIIEKNTQGNEMFFIANGAVSVNLTQEEKTLVSGDFFGEIALLKQQPRVADVVALSYCSLLVLNRKDLESVMQGDDELRQTIQQVGEKRLQSLNQ